MKVAIYGDELYHHGIKGQKWGVRHGPPYPIESGMPKGTKLASISVIKDGNSYKNIASKRQAMYLYNPLDKHDSEIYEGPFSVYAMRRARMYVFKHQYEVIKDLRMPTKKERIDEFIKVFSESDQRSIKELQTIQNIMKKQKVDSKKARTVDLNNLNTKDDYLAAYVVFNHAMEQAYKYRMTKKYLKIMSQKYDAMVDDNNQGVYNGAHDPVIIFRANEALKHIESKQLSLKDIEDNYERVFKRNGKIML